MTGGKSLPEQQNNLDDKVEQETRSKHTQKAVRIDRQIIATTTEISARDAIEKALRG